MQIVVNEMLTNYRASGSGKLIILIHGWGDSLAGMAALAAELSKDYRVLAMDLPGFGDTEAPRETWGLDDYASFVAALSNKLKLGKAHAIIGHSNGGAIAIRGLRSGQLRSDKLVLLASAGIRSELKNRKKIMRLLAKTAKVATLPLPKQLQGKLKRQAYAAIGSDLFVAEHLQDTFKRVVTDDVQADARQLKLPTLLVYGTNDTFTPPSYGEIFKNCIPSSKLLMVPEAGHFVHIDQPDVVIRTVRQFL